MLTQNLYYNHYYPNPKYLIIGYMDPLGTGGATMAFSSPAAEAEAARAQMLEAHIPVLGFRALGFRV